MSETVKQLKAMANDVTMIFGKYTDAEQFLLKAAAMLEFFLNQMDISAAKADGEHRWRVRSSGWPMTHLIGIDPESAVIRAIHETIEQAGRTGQESVEGRLAMILRQATEATLALNGLNRFNEWFDKYDKILQDNKIQIEFHRRSKDSTTCVLKKAIWSVSFTIHRTDDASYVQKFLLDLDVALAMLRRDGLVT